MCVLLEYSSSQKVTSYMTRNFLLSVSSDIKLMERCNQDEICDQKMYQTAISKLSDLSLNQNYRPDIAYVVGLLHISAPIPLIIIGLAVQQISLGI